MKAHELLEIDLRTLSNANNEEINQAYKNKLNELKLQTQQQAYEERKIALENAYNQLNSVEKRKSYIQQLNQPQNFISINNNQGQTIHCVSPLDENSSDIVKSYQSYIAQKIKHLDQYSKSYKEDKVQLESNSKAAEPKIEKFDSFDSFKKGTLYQAISEDQRNKYSQKNYPKETKIITLTFDTLDEAIEFMGNNQKNKFHEEILKKLKELKVQEENEKNEQNQSSNRFGFGSRNN